MEAGERVGWFDGELRPLADVRVSPLSHSLHYGTGVFEGIRCYRQDDGSGGLFRVDDHLRRLERSARVLGYALPWSTDELRDAIVATLRANDLREGYVRPLAWLGEGGMGVAGGDNPVHVLVAVWPWGAYLGDKGLREGIRVLITSFERSTANASAVRAKVTGQYVTSFLAKRQVKALGLDEGLVLDRDGYVCEGTGENLFAVIGGLLLTPPRESAILHGITRDTVLALAADLDVPTAERRFGRTDLYGADEAFLTGTAAEVTPIREIDGRALRSSPGPVTQRVQSAYMDTVRGRNERTAGWITRF